MNINWEACATISALITSLVAIFISISTARRQNKIALYERRYSLYKRCIEFYSIASNYWRNGDIYSIDITILATLEKQIDYDAQEAVFLFNQKVCDILLEGKSLFGKNIAYYRDIDLHSKESKEDNSVHESIVNDILSNQRMFIEETYGYLEL